MIRTRKRMTLCAVLLTTNLLIIWGNSLISGTDSGQMSGSVMRWILGMLKLPDSAADILHLLIRKTGHFTEFACLGALLAWLAGMAGERKFHLWSMPLLLGMAAGFVDETIQMMVPDRGPSLTDVWIDTCGTAAGIAMLIFGYSFFRKHKHEKLT